MMANAEHLAILKQGVAAWNQWRVENPDVRPDLTESNFEAATFPDADFSGVDLGRANLRRSTLSRANLSRADLWGADLTEARLNAANLQGTDLLQVRLHRANLSRAAMIGSLLNSTDLSEARLKSTILKSAIVYDANLVRTDFTQTHMGATVIGNCDLSQVSGIKSVVHHSPSTIGMDTIYRSQGKIPETFLRGAGVPESFIIYMRSLTVQPIEFYSCFISYSSNDQEFAERLYIDLQSQGVRCWFAPKNMKIGDRIGERIDQEIRIYEKLLLVLSENSIYSEWVEREVKRAFDKEQQKTDPNSADAVPPSALFPIRLDDAIQQASTGWARRIKDTRHIGDFSRWKDHDSYQRAFARLMRDLQAGCSQPDP